MPMLLSVSVRSFSLEAERRLRDLPAFDPLYNNSVVMGEEALKDWNGPLAGLANAIVLAEPQAPFILKWIDRYRDFEDSHWAWHSVGLLLIPLSLCVAKV
jgi:hypothetical protein